MRICEPLPNQWAPCNCLPQLQSFIPLASQCPTPKRQISLARSAAIFGLLFAIFCLAPSYVCGDSSGFGVVTETASGLSGFSSTASHLLASLFRCHYIPVLIAHQNGISSIFIGSSPMSSITSSSPSLAVTAFSACLARYSSPRLFSLSSESISSLRRPL